MLVITVVNQTGEYDTADYGYTVRVNDMLKRSGRVVGFDRNKGWLYLLKRIVEQETGVAIQPRVNAVPRNMGINKLAHIYASEQRAAGLATVPTNIFDHDVDLMAWLEMRGYLNLPEE